MKKLKLFGMFALTFALVFGVVSCSNGSKNDDLADVINEADLSGTWKITDIDYSFDCSNEDMAKLYSEVSKEDGKDPDKMNLDEKIEYFGLTNAKELKFATKEEAKAFWDERVKAAEEENKAVAKEIEEEKKMYEATGVDFDASNVTSIEINGGQDEVYYTNETELEVSAMGQSVSMSTYYSITWTKQ